MAGPNFRKTDQEQIRPGPSRPGKLSPRVSGLGNGQVQVRALTYAQREQDTPEEKTEAEIQAEIQSVFRQITASVTFLPMLDGNCTFNVLVYADADSDVPLEWGDSDAKEIENGEKVQLRSFSSSNHRVDTLVSYRYVKTISPR